MRGPDGTLDLTNCSRLTLLRELLGECAALATLNLSYCRALTSLPERLGECATLATLDLDSCSGLMSLPDLSSLPNIIRCSLWKTRHKRRRSGERVASSVTVPHKSRHTFTGTRGEREREREMIWSL